MIGKVNAQFIIIMGKNSIDLAQKLNQKLKISPIIIGFQNSEFGSKNFVQYKEPSVTEFKNEFPIDIREQTSMN